jgi:formylglycine-generating enzyme required for sulfatase activity
MKRQAAMLLSALFAGAAHAGEEVPDIPMVHIAPGSYYMGSNRELGEAPAHKVVINYAFEMGKTEVTQGHWQALMGDNPSVFKKCGADCPVENVSFNDALRFIKQLNLKTGKSYRLPSEAEWEYACRAGHEDDDYCGGNDLDKLGWYNGNSGAETTPVAKKAPNAFGLFDMSGNVWEWVQDYYHEDFSGAPTDGGAWNTPWNEQFGAYRVMRGGSWFSTPQLVSSASRYNLDPNRHSNLLGFRLARTLP